MTHRTRIAILFASTLSRAATIAVATLGPSDQQLLAPLRTHPPSGVRLL